MVIMGAFRTTIVESFNGVLASFASDGKFGGSREGFEGEVVVWIRGVGDIFRHIEAYLMKVKTA